MIKISNQPKHISFSNFHQNFPNTKAKTPITIFENFNRIKKDINLNIDLTNKSSFPIQAPWTWSPDINTDFLIYNKNTTTDSSIVALFFESIDLLYHDYTLIYTDASKSINETGFAIVDGPQVKTFRLPSFSSIFTTESYALYMAVQFALQSDYKYTLIISDSLSALISLQDHHPQNEVIETLKEIQTETYIKIKDISSGIYHRASERQKPEYIQKQWLKKNIQTRLFRLRYAVTEAVKYNRQLQTNIPYETRLMVLKSDLVNGPKHVFGDHTNCRQYFCQGTKESSYELRYNAAVTAYNEGANQYFFKLWCEIEIFAKDNEISIQTPSEGKMQKKKEPQEPHNLKHFDTTATTSAEQNINDTSETIEDYFRKNAFFPVFDTILINLEKRFSAESLQMATAVDQFIQLNFEESLFFVDHYKDLMNVSKEVLQSEIEVAKNCILQSTDKKNITLNHVKKVLTKQTFPNLYKLFQVALTIPISSSTFQSHSNSKKHISTVQSRQKSAVIKNYFVTQDIKENDAVAAIELSKCFHCVKHHHSYLSTDCGVKLELKHFSDAILAKKIRLGRTKMEALVQNVLCPFAIEVPLKKLKYPINLPFSLSTDASNKGNRKLFPLAVRFFDLEKGAKDYLLDFYEEPDETSESIFNTILRAIENFGLDIQNITAFGADNASVNYGKNCSVYEKLLKKKPSIIKANCNCHVLHNTAKHSLKLLKYDVETLVIKVFNEFSISAKRITELKDCFEFVQQDFHNVLRHISVRWLSLYTAVDRLILNWSAIKIYFLKKGKNNCDRIIWKFIKDQVDGLSKQLTLSECYIWFVHHILSVFQKSILMLEKKNLNATDVFDIMNDLRNQISNRKNDEFFGITVTTRLNGLTLTEKNEFKTSALLTYQRAIDYLEKWFNFESSPFKLFTCLKLHNKIPSIMELSILAKCIGIQVNEN
ncbi:hypothetical protein QTP88_023584 [Uroleucon formosanum]